MTGAGSIRTDNLVFDYIESPEAFSVQLPSAL